MAKKRNVPEAVLQARYAKALFLAMDHYFDPHLAPPARRPRHVGEDADVDEDGHEHPTPP